MLTSLLMITCGWVILYPGIQCKCKVQLPVAKLMVCLVCYWKSVFMCNSQVFSFNGNMLLLLEFC